MLRDRLEQRVNELRLEYEAGQKALTELKARQAHIRETLLRISGAIQVLEEELERVDQAASNGHPSAESLAGIESIIPR
jgi:hypothetical protein